MKDGDNLATVRKYANTDIVDGMTIEGRMRVMHHRTIRVQPTTVRAFTEYRLMGAVRVAP